jgi:3-hydroxyacyl-CoA dehydrogenase
MTMNNTAAMIGAGLIGRAWAMVFARAGWTVRLYDSNPTQIADARAYIGPSLGEQQAAGLCDDASAANARIDYVSSLEAAVAGVAWVHEHLPEQLELKRAMFAALDRAAPDDAILASSTSAIPASQFTEGLDGRARCLVAHPVNPPHLVPVVELCGTPWTAPATIERARAIMTDIGQVPIIVRREVDGFILNRLQGALLTEAMRLVEEGYVSPDDLDKTIKDGLGLRWSFMGPFETIELNAPGGVADYCARYSSFYRRLAADPPRPDVWEDPQAARVVSALGAPLSTAERERRTRQRDRRLLALRRHKVTSSKSE